MGMKYTYKGKPLHLVDKKILIRLLIKSDQDNEKLKNKLLRYENGYKK